MPHSSCSRLRRISVSTLAAAVVAGTVVQVAPAHADELAQLVEDLEIVSQEATAKNEEVKALEEEIERAEHRLGDLDQIAATAAEKAAAAKALRTQYQQEVDGIAGSKYRGAQRDPVTNALVAENPQNMIDRSAYSGALARGSVDSLVRIEENLKQAAKEASQANAALAEAQFHRNTLAAKHRQLEAERAELDEDVRAVEERIDSLSADQLAAWQSKNDPEDVSVDLAELSAIGGGVVGAALSKLGSPYGWGAAGPSAFDCSGLIYWAYQQNGKTIPRTSQAQIAGGTPVSRAELQPGDIVGYYSGVTHVGLYIGNGQVVHASDYGIPVQVVSVDSMPWAGAARY